MELKKTNKEIIDYSSNTAKEHDKEQLASNRRHGKGVTGKAGVLKIASINHFTS